ncbi:hypothetical protein QMG25_06630 [Arthrobacter sp. H35-D1]|nr:hypothetical protein [Arthrobacter sp. H35-D1]
MPGEAYHQGYLDGHLAGWKAALAAQGSTMAGDRTSEAAPPRMPSRPPQGESSVALRGSALHQEPVLDEGAALFQGPVVHEDPPKVLQQVQQPAMPQAPTPQAPTQQAPTQQAPTQQPATPQAPQQQMSMPRYPQGQPEKQQLPRLAKPAPLDPAAAAEKKTKRETQNINITLYVASLLMVAAAALFVGSSLPVAARLVGVWLGTALFYSTGLLLHGKAAKLKPAAVAFTGTALAIIPFAGVATYNLGFPDAPAVWLATSLIGTVAYIYAAVRLRSRLVVYVSMAFLLSTAWSSVAIMGAALAWYFTALIIFAAVLALMGFLLQRRASIAGSASSLYAKVFAEIGPWFAPVGLVGSLVLGLALNAADHAMVLMAGAFYYAAMTLASGNAHKRYNYLGFRLSLSFAAPFLGWLIQPEPVWAAAAFTTVLAIQLLAVAYTRGPLSKLICHEAWVRRDVYVSVPVMAVGSFVWSVAAFLANTGTANTGTAGMGAFAISVGVGVGLIAAMALVPAFLPGGEWLPLPAAGAVVLCSPFLGAIDWTALIGVALIYALIRYFTVVGFVLKRAMLVIARILVAALVAASLAALLPANPGKAELIVTVIAVIAAMQLLADALLSRYGTANPVTRYSAVAWAVVGTVLVMALSATQWFAQGSGARLLGAEALLPAQFVLAAAAMGVAAAAYSLPLAPRTAVSTASSGTAGSGTAGARSVSSRATEALAPSYFIVAALCAGPVLHAGGASLAWAATAAYLIVAGALLQRESAPLHRWLYWWTARVVSLLLAVALFQLWLEFDPQTQLAGAQVSLGHIILLALVPQLLILLFVLLRGRAVTGLSTDVCVTLAVVFGLAIAVATGGDGERWTTMVAVGLAAAAVAGISVAGLASGRATSREPLLVVTWAPAAALIGIALACMGYRPLLIIVVAIAVVAWAFVAAAARTLMARSGYFLLARVAATVLVAVVVRELSDNPTVLSLAVTAALLLQVGLQVLATRTARVNAAVGESALLQPSLWLLLAAQLALPLAYFLAASGWVPTGSAARWLVALELAVLAGTALVAQVWLKERGASYLAIVAIMGAAAVVAPLLLPGATALLLLALCLAAIAWRCVGTPRSPEMSWYWLVATGCFLLTAQVVDGDAPVGVFAMMWTVAALALIFAGHLIKQDWVVLPASLLLFLAAVLFRAQVLELSGWPGVSALAGYAVVVGVLYVVRLLLLDAAVDRPVERFSLVGTALGGGAFFALWTMLDHDTVLLGAAAYTVVAVLACMEAPAAASRPCIDMAIVSGAAVWFWASNSYLDLGLFWAIQWCATALGALAVIRYLGNRQQAGKALLMGAAAFASLGAFTTIFSGEPVQQVVSLVVFVALLAVGMGLDERVFTVWGAIGVATAVLWYLRGFTYILLALLALALIAFAIWRLNRKKPDAGQPQQPMEPAQAPHPDWRENPDWQEQPLYQDPPRQP